MISGGGNLANGNNTTYTLTGGKTYPFGQNKVLFFRNGILQEPGVDYIESSATTVEVVVGSNYVPSITDFYALVKIGD
jgi:hypothetical protein